MPNEISMKNTKKEMLDLIETLKNEIKNKEKENLNPEKIKQEAKQKSIVEDSDKIVDAALTTHIHQLKVSINKELTTLSDKLEAEAGKYENLKNAIEIKEAELNEIYGIEKASAELAIILEAQKSAREDFEREMHDKKEQSENELIEKKIRLENEIRETKEQWEKEKAALQFIEKETKNNIEKERKRENEEYAYQLKRRRQLEENKLADDLEKLEKELALKNVDFDKKYQEKTIELNEREKEVSEREMKMKELQDKVNSFPTELDASVKSAVQETKERLTADFTQKEKLLQKGFEGEINVLTAKISAFETLVKEQTKQIEKLNLQQEKAYEKVQDIANKAVSGAAERLQNITVKTMPDKQNYLETVILAHPRNNTLAPNSRLKPTKAECAMTS
jgi:hypothetical protein